MKKYIPIIALIIFFFPACSSSKIIQSWGSSVDRAYKNVLVIGLTGEAEKKYCVKMEKHLAVDLSEAGVRAQAAYEVFGPMAFENMSEDAALNSLRSKFYDAVFVISLQAKSSEQVFIERNEVDAQGNDDMFYQYFMNEYHTVSRNGYYLTASTYLWKTNVYDVEKNALVYSSKTKSFNPNTDEQMGHDYGKVISHDFLKKTKHMPGVPVPVRGF